MGGRKTKRGKNVVAEERRGNRIVTRRKRFLFIYLCIYFSPFFHMNHFRLNYKVGCVKRMNEWMEEVERERERKKNAISQPQIGLVWWLPLLRIPTSVALWSKRLDSPYKMSEREDRRRGRRRIRATFSYLFDRSFYNPPNSFSSDFFSLFEFLSPRLQPVFFSLPHSFSFSLSPFFTLFFRIGGTKKNCKGMRRDFLGRLV